MSLNPRAIATLGIGYGALPMAMLGLWPAGGAQPAVPLAPTIHALPSSRGGKRRLLSGREEARRCALRRQEDELLLTLH